MKTRKLRNIEVSAIGYGCMGLSHGYGKTPDKQTSFKLLHEAYEQGCTFFDTAEGYGNGENEQLLGEGVKPFRKNIVIATKFHLPEDTENVEKTLRHHLENSLKNLQTDYADIYYQHRVNKKIPVETIAEVMGKFIQEGKIRGWGQSQATPEEIRRANAVTPMTAVQSEYSMMERMFEKDVIPTCEELGIGFVAFSPMASGFLSGKYNSSTTYSGDDVRRVITRFSKENVKANQPLLDLLYEVATAKNATPAQISLAWMLHKKDFIVPIPGMRKSERIIENLGAADIELTDEEFNQIERELSQITIYGNRTDEDIAKLRNLTEINTLLFSKQK